ncbi:MAG TPA: hypothetical protein VL285_08410 [Bryobacteraceae bacterium]|jgi:hypothetical protein|nr:hypothetical protein [Bryobacteraceae bacterium]
MRELPEFAELRTAWLYQPEEEIPVDVERIRRRRTWALFSSTRSEVISSIGAALFFAGIMAWRFAPEQDRLALFGCAGVVVWAAATVFRFRNSILRRTPQPDALARTGLEHYRLELLRRRDHLRSVWIWHGPLLLACILSAATLAKRIVPGRLRDTLPAVLLLAGYAAIGIRRRARQAAELQQEIDAISGVSPREE